MKELNPNHEEVREQWYKLCALMLFKSGVTETRITAEDIERFQRSGLTNITIHPKGDVITLSLVNDAEAERLVRRGRGVAGVIVAGTPIEVLPPRDENGRVIADAYGLTGLRGEVTEEVRPGEDRIQVVLTKDGQKIFWSLPDDRVKVIRRKRNAA